MKFKCIFSLIFFVLSSYCFAQAIYYWKSKPLFYGVGLMILVFLIGD